MCGVVGLKVTNSAVSRYGMMGLSRSLDAVGIIASTSQDVAAILEVISGPDARDSSCSARPAYCSARQRPKVIGLRIGIPQNYYWEEISSEVADQLDGVVSRLNKLGMKTVKIDVPFHDVIPALAGILFACEAATLHAHWMHTQPGNYSEEVMARLEPGLHIPAHRYLQALHSRSELAAKFVEEVFNQADVLLTPALRNPIPLLAEVQSLATPSKLEAISKLTHCTRPINFLGLPALVLPCGSTRDGLPVGFQLIGRPFAEGLLLGVADRLEAEGVASGPKMVATQ